MDMPRMAARLERSMIPAPPKTVKSSAYICQKGTQPKEQTNGPGARGQISCKSGLTLRREILLMLVTALQWAEREERRPRP